MTPASSGPADETPAAVAADDDIERSSENVLDDWPEPADEVPLRRGRATADWTRTMPARAARRPSRRRSGRPGSSPSRQPASTRPASCTIPPGVSVLDGAPRGDRRAVGVVVGRFNGEVTTRLLESALDELTACGVARRRRSR